VEEASPATPAEGTSPTAPADAASPATPADAASPATPADAASPTAPAEGASAATSAAPVTGNPEPVAEVPPADPPTISGVDAPPSDATATAAAAGAVAGASAGHTANGRAQTDQDQPRRPWADLEGGYEPDDRTDEVITAYPSARPGPAGAIHGVGITVLVTDLERSVAFYRDILGFFEIDSGRGSAVLASGATRLVLRTVHDLSAEAGRLIYLNLEVGDVEAVYEELKAKGVTFVHAPRPVNRGDKLELWAASFSDPDKHNIAITQWRAVS
jgi:catechol 2,3-dioxygenase-like lactoylglutathione lyase family enzyme